MLPRFMNGSAAFDFCEAPAADVHGEQEILFAGIEIFALQLFFVAEPNRVHDKVK